MECKKCQWNVKSLIMGYNAIYIWGYGYLLEKGRDTGYSDPP